MAKPKTHTIVLTRQSAKYLATAALSGMSTDDITPVICAAHIKASGDELQMLVTDRFRAHSAKIGLAAKTTEHEVLIPRDAMLWLNKNIAHFGRYTADFNRIVITSTDERALTISVCISEETDAPSVAWKGEATKGKFPSMADLIAKARDAADGTPEIVKLDFLAKARSLSRGLESPLIRFTASDNSNKPGAIYLRFPSQGDIYAEAIIQPQISAR